MKGLPDSVILGTIGNAKRRAVKRRIAARRAGATADRYADLTFMHYVGGAVLMFAAMVVVGLIV